MFPGLLSGPGNNTPTSLTTQNPTPGFVTDILSFQALQDTRSFQELVDENS